jgi:hypothetical protein
MNHDLQFVLSQRIPRSDFGYVVTRKLEWLFWRPKATLIELTGLILGDDMGRPTPRNEIYFVSDWMLTAKLTVPLSECLRSSKSLGRT